MGCSGCGQPGHNIRTCAYGPTPGGVNGMRARASVTSSAFGSGATRAQSPFTNLSSIFGIQGRSTNECVPVPQSQLPDLSGQITALEETFNVRLSQLQNKFENSQRENKKREADILEQILEHVETKSQKEEESTSKLKDFQNDTQKLIEGRFKTLYDRIGTVQRKTEENETLIKHNQKSICELQDLMSFMLDKQEKAEKEDYNKKKNTNFVLEDTEDDDDDGELLSQEQLMKLSMEMIKSLKKCRTKEDQIKTVTALAMKYM